MIENIPTLLIPGLGTSPRTYAKILPELWKRGSVTIANQMQHSSMETIAQQILTEAPTQFTLIGHSMGGYIAFEIMRQAPQRVSRLALFNTSARADTNEAKEKRKKQIEKAEAGQFSEIIEATLPSFLHSANQDDETLKEIIAAAHHDAGVQAYIRQQMAIMARKDSRSDLKNIKIPTLVLTGDEDKLIPAELSQEIATGIASAKLVIIPQSGHMTPLEQPLLVDIALAEWLDH